MVILITGCSSGFGLATAKALLKEGHTVYGTTRRAVEPVEGLHYLNVDVTDSATVQSTVNRVIADEGRIDVLINNAGMGIGGPIEFSDEADIEAQMNVNFMGMVRLTRSVLPNMRRAGGGTIICLSSIGGLMGLPFQGFYSASKFAIEGFCEALRLEVKHHRINVVVLNPGDFLTGFTANRRKIADSEASSAYPTYAQSMSSIERDENGGLKPEVLARRVVKIIALRRPRYRYIIATPLQRLSVTLKAILPSRLFSKILGSYYKL